MKFRSTFTCLVGLSFLALAVPPAIFAQHYTQTNLVSDLGMNPPLPNPPDGDLLNPWGLARSSGGPWWISDNNAGLSTIYNGTGAKQGLKVTIPPPAGGASPAAPTGVVFNGSPTDFLVGSGMPAHFIFSTEDGTISGWNQSSDTAVLKVDNSAEAAVYKGATTGDVNGKRFLYVTNFRSAQVEVYDTHFKRVPFSHDDDGPFNANSFSDDTIPSGFAPFNIQNIGGSLFVTYAKQDAPRHDDVKGPGLGYVDI